MTEDEKLKSGIKHMQSWVDFLKARSDNGQHMNIPSNLSAAACWELAKELEMFIELVGETK